MKILLGILMIALALLGRGLSLCGLLLAFSGTSGVLLLALGFGVVPGALWLWGAWRVWREFRAPAAAQPPQQP